MATIEERWKKSNKSHKILEHDLKVKAKNIARRMGLRPIDSVIGSTPQQWYYFIRGASPNKKKKRR